MQLEKWEHDAVDERVKGHHAKAKLHTHGVWNRRVRVGAQEQTKPEYVHVYKTQDPDRFIVHLLDGEHVSHETWESVERMGFEVPK